MIKYVIGRITKGPKKGDKMKTLFMDFKIQTDDKSVYLICKTKNWKQNVLVSACLVGGEIVDLEFDCEEFVRDESEDDREAALEFLKNSYLKMCR